MIEGSKIEFLNTTKEIYSIFHVVWKLITKAIGSIQTGDRISALFMLIYLTLTGYWSREKI